MSTDIYVVSGFLGAGKTTLIQKFLRETFQGNKVALIENDFGEISVDAALLKTSGVQVKEINSGCICCSLQGDFVESIAKLVHDFHPDQIIIEPSGVGKLSDVAKACSNQRIHETTKVKAKITVVDAKCCKEYLDNFGEFYADQIENADTVLLSRTEALAADKIDEAYQLIRGLNPHAFVYTKPWSQIGSDAILSCRNESRKDEGLAEHPEYCCSERSCHDHDGCDHSGSPHCAHDHTAAEIFDTVTIYTERCFTMEELQARLRKMEESCQGKVLRVKGIIRGVNGFINLQYIPGDMQITASTSEGDFISIIGSNLDRQKLSSLFTCDDEVPHSCP